MGDALHVQISDYDTYRSSPTPLDQFQNALKVPIIRVYGALRVAASRDLAYNVVVHVHNYYPYLYIECPLKDGPYTQKYLDELSDILELKLAESFQRKPDINSDDEEDAEVGPQELNAVATKRFIASVHYCRGTAAYGYNLGFLVMLKILLLLALYKTRLTRLIGERQIDFAPFARNRKKPLTDMNVFEAHINYFSQFLADYNLYGCCWLEVLKCHFRMPIVNHNGVPIEPLKQYLASHIGHNNVLNPSKYPRMGKSMLEIDIFLEDILNRKMLRERTMHNDLSEFNNLSRDYEIYLSSLQITFDDLQYQCTSRNKEETSQLLHKLYSQVFENIGKGGFCEWENMNQLRELLEYVKKLNHATGIQNANEYYEKVIQPRLSKGEAIPTCFSLVDTNSKIQFYEQVPLLNFRDDLIKWTSYDQLFDQNSGETNHSGILGSLEKSQTQSLGLPSIKTHAKTQAKTQPQEEIVQNPDLSSPLSDSEPDSMPIPESLPSLIITPPEEHQLQSQVDKHYLALTQKRPHLFPETVSSESGNTFLTQSLHLLLRGPKSIWEYQVPSSLHKKRIGKALQAAGLLEHDYADPSYSRRADVHVQPLVFANKKIVVLYKGHDQIPPATVGKSVPLLNGVTIEEEVDEKQSGTVKTWQYAQIPPTKSAVKKGLQAFEHLQNVKRKKFKSQVEPAVTLTNDFKYSYRPNKVERNPSGFLNMSLMHMEVHVNRNDDLRPNPKENAISMVIFHFDDANHMFQSERPLTHVYISTESFDNSLATTRQLKSISDQLDVEIRLFPNERELVYEFIRKINEYDPDILSGYEVNGLSWGYIIERFLEIYNENLLSQFSRSVSFANGKFGDRWGYTHTSSIKINGRHMLNLWRLLKAELKLTSYTLENVCFHTLHQNLPKFSNRTLSNWIRNGDYAQHIMFFRYYKHKVNLIMQIIDMQEFVLRNVEQSRLIGVDFYLNFYRGSQFKVESILLRIAKSENLLLNSPSKLDVHDMRALDVIPLIMEPDSNFYKSPLVVLDFQSLYPSIMIAYNYCYLTLLGRIEGYNQKSNAIGYMKHHPLPHGIIEMLEKNGGLNISPNGYMFVSSKFRKSMLAKMLEEILNMRINMRSVAAAFSDDTELFRLLNSKQIALKLIANVTYGYTSASFSGRMPNSDIADAIVATGREILTRSIEQIEASDFGAKVIYGDTDSLFVYFPGKSKEDAFKFGKLLAKSVTESLPDPIKLKFEKVYHPCVLLAKKRYVGQCFEHESQIVPKFEAKGIETIRRDGIPAQLKMVGKTLRILFETKDLSRVKDYVIRQFIKIHNNRVNVKDFCFAKAVRYGTYKNEQYLPPGAIVARNRMKKDPRGEPQYKDRVPYLVIKDVTKERLKDRCYSPEDYIASFSTSSPMELDYEYYINKVLVPPLERVFNLLGVKIKEWYRDMLRDTKQLVQRKEDILKVSAYVQSGECFYCRKELDSESKHLCKECLANEIDVMTNILLTRKSKEKQVQEYRRICDACNQLRFGGATTLDVGSNCCNEDCQTYYAKFKCVTEYAHLDEQTNQVLTEPTISW